MDGHEPLRSDTRGMMEPEEDECYERVAGRQKGDGRSAWTRREVGHGASTSLSPPQPLDEEGGGIDGRPGGNLYDEEPVVFASEPPCRSPSPLRSLLCPEEVDEEVEGLVRGREGGEAKDAQDIEAELRWVKEAIRERVRVGHISAHNHTCVSAVCHPVDIHDVGQSLVCSYRLAHSMFLAHPMFGDTHFTFATTERGNICDTYISGLENFKKR
jgi:hypothetical protein